MEYTADELKKVAEYAGLLMTINDIATLLDFDEDELREAISNKLSGISIAYQKGKTQTILELRRQEIELAKLGSPVSIELTQKYMIDQKLSENG